ncbi:type I DNA topoisomerase [Desulfovibrio desulfuricans]|uniref:DNA topoisomerase 1 n=2 Tax=root TaxID=1 RepID=A0A212JKN3_9BACT|nr:type I DNA topoisomerase [Desulfovibrio desulfuricans]MBD8895379.1 type I DNA topoisomerase [Desulfovibrio desulfuricans]MBT9747716.1 type I DNA topoisomerase [Desulfovibrio desulfuricans]MCB6542866.1 type I DNA topoisomerase [Desulfovibrio desulfuricans]MCB6553906.1 type I DNA topoisomerase [Desulfovibrio desulfuricans]MCB6565839.1 type I DNA topoisomerase [Desulfovibrio desulfuricans]
MGKQLIIVESPAKVKTIKKFLGPQYMVQASVGHVRDLPSSSLGVDEANDFAPHYEVIDNKKNVVSELRAAASKADTVYLAPDPDREGEAIAWHVAELIRDKAKDIKRIQFNEITAKAVKEALAHPRELNGHLFDAQQARRVLDRLVGYKISPLLWKSIKRGISAGRVQSVALRLIVEREEAREVFKPEEYWLFKALLAADVPPPFKAELAKVGGKKAVVSNAAQAKDIEDAMAGKPFVVESVEEKERERAPQPPFITSTLQQAANQRLSYTAKRTMNIAQRLYEGVELGDRGLTALITYMRTDSTRIADEARDAAKAFIEGSFGKEYLPKRARVYKAKGGAQDAHEAIRPVDVTITPDEVKTHLPPEQYNLYRLIWSRFVASQMAGARFHDTTASIACAHTQWKAKGERLLFPGFLAAMPRGKDEADAELPPLTAGQTLTLEKLDKEQKFTQPPARFSEASLVRELEELGIGRPSTYAAIISTLQDREYVSLKERHFVPTDLGRVVCTQLVEHFGKLMDVGFTAQMEENLDKVAEGQEQWVELLRRFSEDFNPTLAAASKNMKSLKGGMPANLPCPECGKDLLIKFGKAGAFLACSGYPECRYTSNFERTEDGTVEAVAQEKPQYEKVGDCPQCGKDLVIKKSRTGSSFIACTGYPDCKYAAPLSTGVPCPRCGKGSLVEKSTKRGKIFYSCDQYPQCDFALWDKPVPGPCPRCNSPYLIEKKSRDGAKVICPVKGCGYVKEDGDG